MFEVGRAEDREDTVVEVREVTVRVLGDGTVVLRMVDVCERIEADEDRMDEVEDLGRGCGDTLAFGPWFREMVDRTESVIEGVPGTILRTRVFLIGGLVLSLRAASAPMGEPTEDCGDSGVLSSSPFSRILLPSSSSTRLSSSSSSTVEDW